MNTGTTIPTPTTPSASSTVDASISNEASSSPSMTRENDDPPPKVTIESYKNETQLSLIQSLMDVDLSEPYSIFTYRYFIHQWPYLCFLAMSNGTCVGAVVSKLEVTKRHVLRGYIAMLAVAQHRRKDGIGTMLVRATINAMNQRDCEEVVLEAETSNIGALRLYANLGFIRHKRLEKYYLNGNDAFRLMLRLRSIPPTVFRTPIPPQARAHNDRNTTQAQ